MAEINPLTKDQLFEKKIAENTGSDYNVGDISNVVPVTKDQSFLKEIALNLAGQSEDIAELEGKVTANAEAIEAINENGCCNVLPNNASTTTDHGATFTVNTDKTITIERVTPDGSWVIFKLSDNVFIKAGTYTFTSLYNGSEKDNVYLVLTDMSDVTLAKTEGVESVEYTFASDTAVRFYITIKPDAAISTPITFKPMLYDARLNPTGYVPYAMTNRELTERVNGIYKNSFMILANSTRNIDISAFATGRPYLIMCSGQYNPLWHYMGLLIITDGSNGYLYDIVTDATLTVSVSGSTLTLRNNNYDNNQMVGITIMG